jgi:N-acetyl-anhydromuramyl-L-alanine amidase AmpD
MEKIYEFVKTIVQPDILNVGRWEHGMPLGITIHHSAERGLVKTVKSMVRTKLGYHILIARDGTAHQTAYMDRVVNHAGEAMWNNFSPNRNHLAVSLLSWGELAYDKDKVLKSWVGTVIPAVEGAHRPANNGTMAWWDAATAPQEIELMRFIHWAIKTFNINPKNICGHDECALPKGRKTDPGGVLPYTMKDLRLRLAAERGS